LAPVTENKKVISNVTATVRRDDAVAVGLSLLILVRSARVTGDTAEAYERVATELVRAGRAAGPVTAAAADSRGRR